jgi:hypothetical protein
MEFMVILEISAIIGLVVCVATGSIAVMISMRRQRQKNLPSGDLTESPGVSSVK